LPDSPGFFVTPIACLIDETDAIAYDVAARADAILGFLA
jgi:hypothetical protein